MRRILDAKYENSDLNKVMTKQCQHLKTEEGDWLLILLNEYKDLFDGTLGTWNTTPVDFEFRDNANPVCSRPYPVPRVHKAMFRKEVEILVNLGVLEKENNSEWGATYFAQPKAKTNRVRFISDFRDLNRQLKYKPYTMPKIGETLLNLEGFKYASSLDLNMGYYQIHLRK